MRKKSGMVKRILGVVLSAALLAAALLVTAVPTDALAAGPDGDISAYGAEVTASSGQPEGVSAGEGEFFDAAELPESEDLTDDEGLTDCDVPEVGNLSDGEYLTGDKDLGPDEDLSPDEDQTGDEDLTGDEDVSGDEDLIPDEVSTEADSSFEEVLEISAFDEINDDAVSEGAEEITEEDLGEAQDASAVSEGGSVAKDEVSREQELLSGWDPAGDIDPDAVKLVTVAYSVAGSGKPFTAVCNGRYLSVEQDPEGLGYACKVKVNATVTIKPVLQEHYKLTGTKRDGSSVKTKEGALTFKVTKDTLIEYRVAGSAYLEADGKTVKNNGTVSCSRDQEINIYARDASGTPLTITSASASCTAEGVLTKEEGGEYVVFHAAKASEAKKSSVTVTLKAESATYKVKMKIQPKVTKITLKGFKNGKVSQPAGTVRKYAVSVNSGADPEEIEMTEYEGAGINTKLVWEGNKRYLEVDTRGDELPEKGASFTGGLRASGITDPVPFTVKVTAPKVVSPGVSVLNVSDISATLTLSVPKEARKYDNLYYRIEAKAAVPKGKSVAAGMLESVTDHIPVTDSMKENPVNRTVFFSEDLEEGEGKKQKYTLSVSLIQGKEKDSSSPDLYAAENCYKTKKLTVTTRTPAYETKLALTKKNTTVWWGQENVLLATAKFSKGTSFMKVDPYDSYIINANGEVIDSYLYTLEDGLGIYLSEANESYFPEGKATLHVRAFSPDENYYSQEATLPLTFKRSVCDIEFVNENAAVYKKPGKAASIQMQVRCYDAKGDIIKSPKLKYSIDQNSPLKGIKVNKKGKVTIPKNLILNAETEQNTFAVKAEAADYKGNTAYFSNEIYVINEAVTLGGAGLFENYYGSGERDLSKELAPSEIEKCYMIALDAHGELFEDDYLGNSVSVKCSDPDAFSLDDDFYGPVVRIVSVKKAGTFTFTFTTTDGGKQTKKITLKVKRASKESLERQKLTARFGKTTVALSPETPAENTQRPDQAFSLEHSCPDADGFYENSSALTIKSGGTISRRFNFTEDNIWWVIPTSSETVVTLTANGKSTDYTINNTAFDSLPGDPVTISPAEGQELIFYANGEYREPVYEFKIDGLDPLPEASKAPVGTCAQYVIDKSSDPDHMLEEEDPDYDDLWNAIFFSHNKYRHEIRHEYSTSEDPHSFTLCIKPVNVKPGTYTIYISVIKETWEGNYGSKPVTPDKTAQAMLIPITFTAKKVNYKNPSGNLNTKYKIKKETGASVQLTIGKQKNVTKTEIIRLYNDNKNGMPNEFTSCFSLDPESGKLFLSDYVSDPADIPAKDMSGYVEYAVENGAGKRVTKTARITVSWK
ncbi:MAG: hypothetical protein K6F53_06895 [Lachnospiraceae bacterium]|nr:hypothetical protein [Lachnospiraceae bacterium]